MRHSLLIALFICLVPSVSAQEGSKPLNSLYVGIFGDASMISLNYERLFPVNRSVMLSGKIGVGYFQDFRICLIPNCGTTSMPGYFVLPHHLTANFGKDRIFFEAGLGGNVVGENPDQPYVAFYHVGLRVMPSGPIGTCFRLYFQLPLTGRDALGVPFFVGGVSLGLSF